MPSSSRLFGLLGTVIMMSSAGCVERVIVEEDPLGGFASEEAMCRRYCDVLDTCGYYDREVCLGECIRPHEKWPWLTDECLDLRREVFVCHAGYDTCDEYDRRSREGDPCLDEQYDWEAAGYECFGQYLESDGWQGSSGSSSR
jgi:hypothetical protein